MRLTQLRIFSLISTIVSTIILVAALSTDKWYVSSYSFTSAALTDKSYGIFNDCSQDDCINKREGWKNAVIACLITALCALILALLGFIFIIATNRNAKVLAMLLLTAAISSCVALVIYPLMMNISSSGSMDASYYLGCASAVISTGAGIFILATKEERIAPLNETFSNISLDFSNEV